MSDHAIPEHCPLLRLVRVTIDERLLEEQAMLIAKLNEVRELRRRASPKDADYDDRLWALNQIDRALSDAKIAAFPIDHWWWWKFEHTRTTTD